jgi:hypothetical protein
MKPSEPAQRTLIRRLADFSARPNEVKLKRIRFAWRRLLASPLRFGFSSVAHLHLGYHPDSYADNHLHSEVRELQERFVLHNSLNNSGDWARLWAIVLNVKQVIAEGIEGNFAELGVWRGNTASVLAYYASCHGRRLHLFDTFSGFDQRDLSGVDADKAIAFRDTSMELVRSVIGQHSDACDLYPGHFPSSVETLQDPSSYSVVSLDCDLYEPMRHGLQFFYPRLSSGGVLLLHDYSSGHWQGATQAVNEFCLATGEKLVLLPDKSGSAVIRKASR